MTHTLHDLCPAARERCPIDLALLSRWFLEHDGQRGEASCADAPAETQHAEEVAA